MYIIPNFVIFVSFVVNLASYTASSEKETRTMQVL